MSPAISRWLASWPSPVEPQTAARRIVAAQAESLSGRALHWLVEHRQSAQAIGWLRITRIETEPDRGELGYWIGEPFQGMGYASEAARAAVAAGFERLDLAAIEGGAQLENEGSFVVMRRIGMERSGERSVWASARQRHELCVYYEIKRTT